MESGSIAYRSSRPIFAFGSRRRVTKKYQSSKWPQPGIDGKVEYFGVSGNGLSSAEIKDPSRPLYFGSAIPASRVSPLYGVADASGGHAGQAREADHLGDGINTWMEWLNLAPLKFFILVANL